MKSASGKRKSQKNLNAFRPSVRHVRDLEIYFRSRSTVAVNSPNGTITFINVGTRNFYRNHWKPFTEKLRRRNNLCSIFDIMDIAARHGIPSISPRVQPAKVPHGIYEHPSRYIHKRNNPHEKKKRR